MRLHATRVFGLALLLVLGAAGGVAAQVGDPVAAATTFFSNIENGRRQQAFEQIAPDRRSLQGNSNFGDSLDRAVRGQGLGAGGVRTLQRVTPLKDGTTIVCFVERPASGQGNLIYLSALMTPQPSGWMVAGYQISSQPYSGC